MTHIYWGDLHSHCSISYGQGTVEQALLRARQQLDFCSVTGHAFWPDMPTDRSRYGEIIDYHREGFARLAGNWEKLLAAQRDATVEGEFIAMPSYEWHSLRYGDHNLYARGPDLPLVDAVDLPDLRRLAAEQDALIIPHHIGYAAGYRGIDWSHFESSRSPFVEVYSLHGNSLSTSDPYPMLHDMGPRDSNSTAEAGWRAGHRFGVIASTDHHGGFPGSHGDGRLAAIADSLTRDSLWDAFQSRRVYAVTGDKIQLAFSVNDAPMGSDVQTSGNRHVRVAATGCAPLDQVEVFKNGASWRRLHPAWEADASSEEVALRVTWGWGQKTERVDWEAELHLSDGRIAHVETCFSGQSVVAPKGVGGHAQDEDEQDLPHEIIERGERTLAWRSVTSGNLSTRHPTHQSIIAYVRADQDARICLQANGNRYDYGIGELAGQSRVHYLRGWLSEAMCLGPASPLSERRAVGEFVDDEPVRPGDYYRVAATQRNGQCAWSSPIWID
ncbi:MAG: hypothetical protein QGG36_00365 [Pirellulaceae bacterium]|jgi:hypothetical protein|nr:hypothetical protein [Pirellulaceae bacterium]MDP7014229.1 hypothetical protein [Pirellulaceae bacterium]